MKNFKFKIGITILILLEIATAASGQNSSAISDFEDTNLGELLNIISQTCPIDFTLNENNVIIINKNN